MRTTVFVLRMIIGISLVNAGLMKTGNLYYFLQTIISFKLVDAATGSLVAAVFPFLELGIGVCLLLGLFSDGAILLCPILFAAMSMALWSVLARDITTKCGCFGVFESEIVTTATFLRAAAFTGVSLVMCVANGLDSTRETQGRMRI